MPRFRRYRKSGGGGGSSSSKMPFILLIFGAVAVLVDVILFGVAIQQLDTAYTTASTYSGSFPGLTSIMGIWGLVLFLLFMSLGLASIAGGAFMSAKRGMSGNWMNAIWSAVMGAVAIVVALILNGVIIAQLYAAEVTVNATTNAAQWTGLISVMGIFGMVVFVTLMGAGIAMIVSGAYGGYKAIRGR